MQKLSASFSKKDLNFQQTKFNPLAICHDQSSLTQANFEKPNENKFN